MAHFSSDRSWRSFKRGLLNHYVLNGLEVALGLFLVTALVHLVWGVQHAAAASVGVIVTIVVDAPAPRRGKFWRMLPAPLLGAPLFWLVQLLHQHPVLLGFLAVFSTFFGFLWMAWGKRGGPIAIAVVLAMVLGMSITPPEGHVLEVASESTMFFAIGALSYLLYAVAANALLNLRYRVQFIADTVLSLAALMLEQARMVLPEAARHIGLDNETVDGEAYGDNLADRNFGNFSRSDAAGQHMGQLLARHAAFADQLQSARDIVLESPRTPRRQRLAGMLMQMLEIRDHLLACELDLESLRKVPEQAPMLLAQQAMLRALAIELVHLADSLLLARKPRPMANLNTLLLPMQAACKVPAQRLEEALPDTAEMTPQALSQELSARIVRIHDEVNRLIQLGRDEAEPDLAVVRASWQMFVSPTAWSWSPFKGLMSWDAPPLRHAIRAALAIALGYLVVQLLPWKAHAYWVLLTIVVVLRGSLAQTLERRTIRVLGTLLGCVAALGILSAHLPPLALILCLTLAQGISHGFAARRYLFTAMGATVLGLVQAHMLNSEGSTSFHMMERVVDTVIGTGIAWAFAYVLPSWERSQLPALLQRVLKAQAAHVRTSLSVEQLQAVDNAPELAWRLARREAYDSLSALVQAVDRSLKEPRAVQPPLQALEQLQAHCYQLLGQMSSIKIMLMMRRGQTPSPFAVQQLQEASADIDAHLLTPLADAAQADNNLPKPPAPERVPDPKDRDLLPWLMRRLAAARILARQLQGDAAQIQQALAQQEPVQASPANAQAQ
ncbi:FUSC family protein [Comamonas sp. J-3]|uniref:FUSC family protein n=1 Tax=Comamonas trifloxystrobinivorans TaxID=3350256 RepID=UPI003726F454